MNATPVLIIGLAFLTPVLAEAPKPDPRLARLLERSPEADRNKDGKLTHEEALEFLRKRRGERPNMREARLAPTHPGISYGDHPQQAFDLWLAKSSDGKPTPLCIFIHGGGFRGGDKRSVSAALIKRYLDAGVSFASMNYRLTDGGKFPYPTAMHDAARGLQFIRSKAGGWNLNPERVVCYGGSAGAGISLWLAFHDDLADPDSDDPVARQSTRILAAGTTNGQSSYDMRTIRKWFDLPNMKTESALFAFYNIQEGETPDTPRVAKLAEDASPINHLDKNDQVAVHMSYSRPPIKVDQTTSSGVVIHHAIFGLKLQQAMKKLGLECVVVHPGKPNDTYKDLPDFLIKKLHGP